MFITTKKQFKTVKINFRKTSLTIKKTLKTIFIGNTRPRQMFNFYLYFLLFGTILLMTPVATVKGQWNFLQALFTASSAFSDTGLTIKSTANDFTFFGQLVILILIKIGGIGLITVKLFLLSFFRFGIYSSNLKERLLLQQERGSNKLGNSVGIIKIGILVMTLTEFLGAITLALYFYFVPNDLVQYGTNTITSYNGNFWISLWAGIFHSISAVNNAGFDIAGQTSLTPFVSNYFVQWVFIVEFVIGGIGFPVFYDLYNYIKSKHNNKNFHFSLFTKVTLITYFLITFFGVGSVLLIEIFEPYTTTTIWNNMSTSDSVMAIIFNTMSTRNAGFYTIDLNRFHTASQVIQSIMMWIGSSPASTAGGIRTTTFAIIVMSVISAARGKQKLSIFKRRVPDQKVKMAFIVATTAASLVIFTSLVILFENLFIPGNESITFIQSLYDASSAFGTTGLSLFDNAQLGVFSKICLIILMFVGQLGVSTTILAWSDRKRKPNVRRIEEDIIIG